MEETLTIFGDAIFADSENRKFSDSSKIPEDAIFSDLHIHSKYSRATSLNLSFENLVKWAKVKGVNLLGTGDFTHPIWFEEIKKLKPNDKGFYYYNGFPFIITGEISLIYTQGRGRRIHLVLLVPNIETAEKINAYFDTKGRRDYDGRPIFKISGEEFVREMKKISEDIEVIPAHCLLPEERIHVNNSIKMIKEIKEGDIVYTHNNRWQTVKEVLKRKYSGRIYKIRPWYFSEGLTTTPEHPFFAVKSYKNCSWTKGLCKKGCSQEKNCKKKHFLNYKNEWILAKDLEKGDFLIYPRFNQNKDTDEIRLTNFISDYRVFKKNFLLSSSSRNNKNPINNLIKVDKDFCLLIGYFLSEGYLINKEAVAFSFNAKEKDYIDQVILLMNKIFGLENFKIDNRRENQADIIFQSVILNKFFSIFYSGDEKRAWTKKIPPWLIFLPKEKIAEILMGWWRGDFGTTVSRELASDMKQVCLKLGIIPSIYIQNSENFNKQTHFINTREIISKRDFFIFNNLSFFEEDFGMLRENCFKKSVNKINRKHGWIDNNYIYIPVRKIENLEYRGEVYNLEVEEDNSYVTEFACVHNCWTPWFGVFGSESGFDSLKECFGNQIENIHAIETGMSSSPEMNWNISELNNKAIVSFSDSHSFWPFRLGREATIFKKTDSYKEIIRQIREKDFIATIETDPAYGKYHWDGHRLCNFSCSPEESRKLNSICPVCKKPLTIGVEYRVEQLTNQKKEENKNQKPFFKLLPLQELIALELGSTLSSKKTWEVYNFLIERFGNEFNILLKVDEKELIRELPKNPRLVELILKNRQGKIKVNPGFDGEYGVAMLEEKQKTLF